MDFKFFDKTKTLICGIVSAAMVFCSGAVFAAETDQAASAGSADSITAQDNVATAAPDATAVPSPEPEPTATPQDKAISANIAATYYTTDTKNLYKVAFKTESDFPEITAFEITVTFDGATVESAEFGSDFNKNGTTSKTVTDDKTVKYIWKDGSPVSGAMTLVGANITSTATPSGNNITIDEFSALCADGSRLTIMPKLSVAKGTNMPELDKTEQEVYDMIMALPSASEFTFYDSADSKELVNVSLKYRTPIDNALSAYGRLTAVQKKNVDTALSISSISVSDLSELLTVVDAMQDVYGIMELVDCYSGTTDDSTAINYQFLTETYNNVSSSAPAALSKAPKAYEEFNAAVAEIEEYNKIVEKNVKLLSEKTYENYQLKIGSLKTQYDTAKKLNQLTYSKAFISSINLMANELYDDIDKNYTGSYKDYMLSDVQKILDEIESGGKVYEHMPTFEASSNVMVGYNIDVSFKRYKTLVEDEAEVSAYIYDKNGKLIEDNSAAFKPGNASVSLRLKTSPQLFKGNETYSIKCYYTYDGISYYLGSSNVLMRPAKTQNTGGSTGGSTGSSGNTGGSGNYYPPVDPDTPSPTMAPSMAYDNPYTDIDDYGWAYDAIIGLTNAGIVNGMGDNEFNPAGNVTREQFCKMVVQLFGVSVNDTETDFVDVDENAWYAPYITAAVQAGYVQGQSDEYFGVGEPIMRQDMATILYRAANKTGDGVVLDFTDNDSIAPYATDAVSELVGLGIMNGYEDGSFKPRGNATRAEAAKVIWGVYGIL